jgi:hypothetical protein
LSRLTDPVFMEAAAGPMIVAVIALWAIVPTLLPTVADWDTAEFQTVGPVLGTAHPTGYPAYVILGWLASVLFQPFGEPAFRMNLLQGVIAAAAAGATTALVGLLTGRRYVALAAGLLLLAMPFVSDVSVTLPVTGTITTTPVFMRLATHADPHMFHAALVATLFIVLIVWDRRLHGADRENPALADRWLIAAAFVYAVAVANHSLALLLPPAIGLFVLMADWRVILRWRTVVACVVVLVATLAVLFAELPIRAAMNAPLVYGHPDTLGGFTYVVLAEQFRGSLVDPLGHLGDKASAIVSLMSGWLGPLIYLAILGLGTSLIRRPRYVVLSGLTLLVTCFFSTSYANADIERYFLVPVLVAITWVGLGAADLVGAVAFAASWVMDRVLPDRGDHLAAVTGAGDADSDDKRVEANRKALAGDPGSARAIEPDERQAFSSRSGRRYGWALIVGELAVAVALVVPVPAAVSDRQEPESAFYPGGVSEAQMTDDSTWLHVVLAPADKGGLPENSVLVYWWSASTTLWYGQRVLGLRPDIYIVDDRTRLDDNLGSVQDVFNKFLGNRPVFTIRVQGGVDGMVALSAEFDIKPYSLGDGSTISRVVGRKGNQ